MQNKTSHTAHPRESGDPEQHAPDVALDPRFRGDERREGVISEPV
jgi:hypothetical protein